MKKRVAIFASGSGSNAASIMQFAQMSEIFEVDCVICNRQQAGVYDKAERYKVPSFYFSKKSFIETPEDVLEFLKNRSVDLIVLAGFLVKVPSLLINEFRNQIVNIHPSLLPKYGGKGMYGHHVHEAVLHAGETESGLTIHLVTEEYDKGQYLFQYKLPIEPDDNVDTLSSKVLDKEHSYYPTVLEYYIQGLS